MHVLFRSAACCLFVCTVHAVLDRYCRGLAASTSHDIQMSLETPYPATRIAPVRALEALSSRVLHASLKACMGPYLERLVEDYEAWAEGRPRRQDTIEPLEASQLFLEAEASVVDAEASVAEGSAAAERRNFKEE